MRDGLFLLVDVEHVTTREVTDVEGGEVREERISAVDVCDALRLSYCPLTKALKQVLLYERKAKAEGRGSTPVTLGDLGPYVFVRVVGGVIQNKFGVRDFCKPIPVSAETLRQLAAILGGKPDLPAK